MLSISLLNFSTIMRIRRPRLHPFWPIRFRNFIQGCGLAILGLSLAKPAVAAPPVPIDVWTQMTLPGLVAGDYCQSIVVDPVNPGTLITGCGNNDGRKIKWYRSTDYGDTWTLINNTAMNGNPWGFSIDPNPSRDPSTAPTLYSPAGYGSMGIWKSTDGGSNWNRLTSADTVYAPYNPFGPTDVYHTAILPDDMPNHLLVTYHYGFKDNPNNEGGFGESWDGGQNWVIHQPPAGVGSSHYVIPISATTWCVISQETDRGIWRTTTAGRVGGTPAQKYRDGVISTNAWIKVGAVHAHLHGSYTPLKIGNIWYSPGYSDSEGDIWKSTDDGATWSALVPGYYWPFPPNAAFLNKNATGLAATDQYLYSNYFLGPEIARAPRTDDTKWIRNYTATPAGLQGFGGNPMGNASIKHLPSGHWLVFMATNNGVWRYVEPLSDSSPIVPPSSAIITITVTDPIPLVAVSLSPSSASVIAGATSQLTATVTGAANTAVTWSVQEGNTGGTVSSAGLYTAANVAGTYHVVATSTADNSKSATATVTVTTLPGTASYATNFDLTESPISEKGVWRHFGSDWTLVNTSGGNAFGTQTGTGGYDDSYAYLSGFGPDQSATAVIHRDAIIDSRCTHEVEILLRWADSAHNARGYECNVAYDGGYAEIVRWNGPLGDFTYLARGSVPGGVHDGDVVSAKAVGTSITLFVNGAQVAHATDATFPTGNPGMGFWRGGSFGLQGDYAFTSYSATSPVQ